MVIDAPTASYRPALLARARRMRERNDACARACGACVCVCVCCANEGHDESENRGPAYSLFGSKSTKYLLMIFFCSRSFAAKKMQISHHAPHKKHQKVFCRPKAKRRGKRFLFPLLRIVAFPPPHAPTTPTKNTIMSAATASSAMLSSRPVLAGKRVSAKSVRYAFSDPFLLRHLLCFSACEKSPKKRKTPKKNPGTRSHACDQTPPPSADIVPRRAPRLRPSRLDR